MTDYDTKYRLTGTCTGCRRVKWLCRRNRRCSRYSQTVQAGYVATPTGFYPPRNNAPGNNEAANELDAPQQVTP